MLKKVGTIISCTYCKEQGHNTRSGKSKVITYIYISLCFTVVLDVHIILCSLQKIDMARKAVEEGVTEGETSKKKWKKRQLTRRQQRLLSALTAKNKDTQEDHASQEYISNFNFLQLYLFNLLYW